MPILDLRTNVNVADKMGFVREFSKFSAETLGAPEQYVSVHLDDNKPLTFSGTLDPAFQLSIVSLNNLNPEANQQHSKAFFAFLEEKLGVPSDRGFIVYNDPGPANIGLQGATVATVFKMQ